MTYKQAIDVNESYRNDINLKPPIAMAVSYTHLDVYKRQTQYGVGAQPMDVQ